MAGRKPKPTKVLKLEKGKLYDDQKKRDEAEPKPKKDIRPKCPARFNKKEKDEWKYISTILENYGLFDIANATLIELLATNLVHYKDCAKKVADKGIIIRGPKGGYMYNPFFTAMNKIEDKIQKCLSELGLSSSALAKLGAAVVRSRKTKEEMEDLLD